MHTRDMYNGRPRRWFRNPQRLQIVTLHLSHLTLHPKVTERACKAKGTSEMMCSFRPLQQQQAAAAAASSSKHKQQHHHQAAARIINALVMTTQIQLVAS